MTLLAGDPQSFLKGLKNLADKATANTSTNASTDTPKESAERKAVIEKIKKFVSCEIISVKPDSVRKVGGAMTGIVTLECKITNISNEIIHGVQGNCYAVMDGKMDKRGILIQYGISPMPWAEPAEPIMPSKSIVIEASGEINMSEEMWKSVLENKTYICIFDGLASENENIKAPLI
jgi:hypothetical protein